MVPFDLRVRLALGRRIFNQRRVIAEGGPGILRIETAEHAARVLAAEVLEDFRERFFERIYAGCHGGGAVQFALGVKRQVAIRIGIAVVVLDVASDFGRTCRVAVVSNRDIRNSNKKPIVTRQAEIAAVDARISLRRLHRDLRSAQCAWHDLLNHEVAMIIYRNIHTEGRHALPGGDAITAYCECAAIHRDVADVQSILTESRKQGFFFSRLVFNFAQHFDQREGQRLSLVKLALRTVNAQTIEQGVGSREIPRCSGLLMQRR